MPTPLFTNRLALEKSPYLLQHAHNPVDWYPWGEEAFAKAQSEDKPIFLSVGYSTCHWCHVMERESFESEEIARVLNEHFVAIKVDREERPDVDRMYMLFVQASTGSGASWELGNAWRDKLSVVFRTDFRDINDGFPPLNLMLTQSANVVLDGKWKTAFEVADAIDKALARLYETGAIPKGAPR